MTVLSDTGSVVLTCRKALVERGRWTRERITIKTADGDKKRVPGALVNVETPYLTGEFFAVLLDDPPADLIIGNVGGARLTREKLQTIAAVETRGQVRASGNQENKLRYSILGKVVTSKSLKNK